MKSAILSSPLSFLISRHFQPCKEFILLSLPVLYRRLEGSPLLVLRLKPRPPKLCHVWRKYFTASPALFCKSDQTVVVCAAPGGWGTETKNNLIRGGSAPKAEPLPFYILIFGRKDTPFIYLPLTNGFPFVYHPLKNSTPSTYILKQYSHKVCVRNILMKGPFNT